MPFPLSSSRLSVMLGLLFVMLATLPRYWLGQHQTRLTLMLVAMGVVSVVLIAQWRMLDRAQRRHMPHWCARLAVAMIAGLALAGMWYLLVSPYVNAWPTILSHGATLGLFLHVLSTWWRPD
ncbi:hypothetical protein GCM10027040_29190 [Halomonas shantousis]